MSRDTTRCKSEITTSISDRFISSFKKHFENRKLVNGNVKEFVKTRVTHVAKRLITFDIIYPSLDLYLRLLTDLTTVTVERCIVNTTNSFTQVNKEDWDRGRTIGTISYIAFPTVGKSVRCGKVRKARFPNAAIIAAGESCG